MIIAAFEPFYGGSHRQWLDGYAANSSHELHLFTLPARNWKWRMYGAAVTLARKFLESNIQPDCILATDMIDLGVLLSLIRRKYTGPSVLYMHENQLNYPWSESDPDPDLGRDHHYAFVNYTSCLAADQVLFNSEYHRNSFLGALPAFLGMFPDNREIGNNELIRGKSRTLPIGLDLKRFDRYPRQSSGSRPTILWNHRWEYDKGPEEFFGIMKQLSSEGCDFGLIVCGGASARIPGVFDEAHEALGAHIEHWGMVDSFNEYAGLLRRSHFLPVTSRQDFFGISTVEAMYCGVHPLLPDRLALIEHLPQEYRDAHLYNSTDELIDKLRKLLSGTGEDLSRFVRKYDWSELVDSYDKLLQTMIAH